MPVYRRLKPIALLLLVCVALPLLVQCAGPSPTPAPPTDEPEATVTRASTTAEPTQVTVSTEVPPTVQPAATLAPPVIDQNCEPLDPDDMVDLIDPGQEGAGEPVPDVGFGPNLDYDPFIQLPFIENHLIVTGILDDVTTVIDVVNESIGLLEGDGDPRQLNMDFLPLVQPPDWPVIFPPQNLVVRLYQIQTDVPLAVAEVISATQSLFDRGEISFPVFADPNYITGFQPVPLSADPWDIGGAPWDIGGATVTATSSLAQVEYFWPQWALNTSEGIAIIDAPPTRTVTYTGAAKHVVVFDTSPFTGSMRVFFQGWLTPDFRVCVSHPQPDPLPALDLSPHPLVPDHGLFAAGLVYGVAPEVEIDLVRALNNEGQGDMFWLLANMAGYAARASRSGTELRGVGVLSDTVFNLSLGVHPTTPTESIGLTPEQVEWIKTVTRGPLGALGNWGAVDPPVVALETVLSILHQHNGATIVAAAGNGSANTGEPPYEANMPARYPFVIGVSGSNVERTQACFSNMGLVAAPAGDGGRPLASVTPATTAQPPCYPQFENKPCPDRVSGDCRWGVISVVVAKHLGFAIWAGTSFATPLVSGLAALELEAGIPYTQVLTHTLESVDVSGVVSVPNAVVP